MGCAFGECRWRNGSRGSGVLVWEWISGWGVRLGSADGGMGVEGVGF